jgi:hypothetical protein
VVPPARPWGLHATNLDGKCPFPITVKFPVLIQWLNEGVAAVALAAFFENSTNVVLAPG